MDMKTYVKNYGEMNEREKQSFLNDLAYADHTLKDILNEDENYVKVAFTRNQVAVDYCVFDPYHEHIAPHEYVCYDGWTNWQMENYDEDEEVESEEDLPDLWNEMTCEEKMRNLSQIDETYHFSSDYSDASDAAAAVRTGFKADPEWFGFEVDDEGEWWEEELSELLAPFFAKDIELSTLDEVEASAYCLSEGKTWQEVLSFLIPTIALATMDASISFAIKTTRIG